MNYNNKKYGINKERSKVKKEVKLKKVKEKRLKNI